ncbi:Gfo/Idh/MocA family oxidoreductase [candidate division WOR-3 bacterium]|nr:Gfo/Idh/MocA family oxidoreductase [candidate division WOR-3 bacterium]
MKVGVIGLGYWGPNLMRSILSFGDIEVVGCEKNEGRLEEVRKIFPNATYIKDYNNLLDDDEVKAVLISTPVCTHYSIAKDSLDRGKDVFVEKPLTESSPKAMELIDLAAEKKSVLMVGHIFEYNDAVIKINDIIKNDEVGELQYITSTRVNLGIHRKDVNVLWDLAPHDLSIIFKWVDSEPVSVATMAKASVVDGLPDVAFVQLAFDCGMIADIQVGWLAPSKVRETIIVGSKKMIVYNETNPREKVKIYNSGVDFEDPHDYGEFLLSYRSGDIHSPTLSNREPLRIEMEHFLKCVRERKKPLTDGYSALRVIKAIEMAEKSFNEKRIVYQGE